LLPGCSHDELKTVFADKHFYVFPSQQEREGQSNAVTEAMSQGVIPIASPQGFSRSTIGDDYLIVDELTAEAYAERIAEIIRKREIEKYSQFVRKRFLENYTEKAVFGRMRGVFASFWE
jgi:glycosyltransferase involved in cell wall biosynthesis